MFTWIDVMGPVPQISIKGDLNYKSQFGAVLTFLVIILVVLAFAAFGRDIFEKQEPFTLYNKNLDSNPDRVLDENFTVMFAMVDNQAIPFKQFERKFKFYVEIGNTNKSRKISDDNTTVLYTPYDMVPCTSLKINPDVKENLVVDLSHYWCFPRNQTFELVNQYGGGTAQYLRIQLELCKNSTLNNNHCLPEDEIYKELTIFNLHYVMSDIILDGYNYLNPGTEALVTGYTKGNMNTFSRTFFFVKNTYYVTDEGWIIKSPRPQKYLQIDHTENQLFFEERTKIFFSHVISLTKFADTYNRAYIKIQGVMAYVGGFLTFIQFLLRMVNKYVQTPFIYQYFENLYYKITPSSLGPIQETEPGVITSFSKFIPGYGFKEKRSRTEVVKTKIRTVNKYELHKLKFRTSLFRVLFCLPKIKHMQKPINDIGKMFTKTFSLESLIKTIKMSKLMTHLLFNDYQIDLTKYLIVDKVKRMKYDFGTCIKKLSVNHSEDTINQKFLHVLSTLAFI